MKKVEAIIRTSKFDDVKSALHDIGIDFFSYWDATGVGNEKKKGDRVYRGTVLDTEFIPRRLLTIVVRDLNLDKTVNAILENAFTGEVGDGKIFVSTIDDSWRIRTKEHGDETLFNKD